MNNIVNFSVFKFFEQISKIPRNSGDEKAMQNFLINFAKKRNLPYYADEFNNVIIYKKTINEDPIILQAHTDMVCVKKNSSLHNFKKDGIKVIKKGNYLTALNTSLGADDGIGVAIILEILDTVENCNIEAVFTASEETTMQGAYNLDVKKLKAKKMICLDGFEANTIMTSSASFTDFYVNIGTEKLFVDNTPQYKTFKISLSGLMGGHSGFDIDKNRGSSNKLLASLLLNFPNIYLNSFIGGHNYNVIPSKSEAVFSTTLPEKDIKNIIKFFITENKKNYKDLKIKCYRQLNKTLVLKNGIDILKFIDNFEQGIIKKENDFVLISQNLSEVNTNDGCFKIGIRCNEKNEEKEIIKNLKNFCKTFDFEGKDLDTQPCFNTLDNSTMLENLKNCNLLAREIKMHIGVECGIFQDRIKKLDVVIISPTIIDAHSVNEKLEIYSVVQTLSWLKNYLKIEFNQGDV